MEIKFVAVAQDGEAREGRSSTGGSGGSREERGKEKRKRGGKNGEKGRGRLEIITKSGAAQIGRRVFQKNRKKSLEKSRWIPETAPSFFSLMILLPTAHPPPKSLRTPCSR